ncbi:unnamed protein product [Sphenostylis stenocarpa]|uniref:Glutaredoxin domain-containing protein n=1 Tax=Sphenostylis stenocarpa TaxID=92480 RepID=A0AA86TBM3_9FABA|nr:unnamed protein product [Sphenostylis stenocarpa]
MWRPWRKSTVQTSPSSPFSCSSFKDIQTLLDEPPQPQNQRHQDKPSSSHKKKPSIFHRVRLANSLLRTWSTHIQHQSQPPKLSRTRSHPEPPQPTVSKLEPNVSPLPKPGVSKPEPNVSLPDPGASRPEPNVSLPDPGASRPEPNVSLPDPGVSKPETNVSLPEPGVSKPEPNVSLPDPGVSKPEPNVSLPDPGVSKPEHNVSLPDPGVSKPEPNVSIPKKQPPIYFPLAEECVVVYYTSLHAVRPTFDACKNVFSILRGFRVKIDDRDVSIDSGFAAELKQIMGLRQAELGLPHVFIAGKYVGGVEELRQLNDGGELKKLLENLPVLDPSECHMCAGHRFVLCDTCNGSKKHYIDKVGFKTCNMCNQNGLLRCPSCLANSPTLSHSQIHHQIQN